MNFQKDHLPILRLSSLHVRVNIYISRNILIIGIIDNFSMLCDGIRGNIFAISGNITSIQRMTANFGTDRDTQEMRDKL